MRCSRCYAGHEHAIDACEVCGIGFDPPSPLYMERFPVHRRHEFGELLVEFEAFPGAVMVFEQVTVNEAAIACMGCAASLGAAFGDVEF